MKISLALLPHVVNPYCGTDRPNQLIFSNKNGKAPEACITYKTIL